MVEVRTRPWFELKGVNNWKKLLKKLSKFDILSQHYTTSGKLRTASYHFRRLIELVPENTISTLQITIKADEQGRHDVTFPIEHVSKVEEYLRERDGFLYSLRGCLDSFFWEVNLIFNLGLSKISYGEVKQKMKKEYGTRKTTRLLMGLQNEPWFVYLSDVRNELTHHTLSELVTFTEDDKLYLPDDPLKNTYSRESRYEVPICLKTLRDATFEFLEKGYKTIWDDLSSLYV